MSEADPSQVYYAQVSYGKLVLCDCYIVPESQDSTGPANYDSLCQLALEYVEKSKQRCSKKKNKYKDKQRNLRVYVYSSQGINYFAVVIKGVQKDQVFNRLVNVERAFQEKGLHEQAEKATPYSMRQDFSAELESAVCGYVPLGASMKGTQAKAGAGAGATIGTIRDVKQAMSERGDKLSGVQRSSDGIRASATEYQRLTKGLNDGTQPRAVRSRNRFCLCCFH